MFSPGDRVAVAVSGGADSVCLLHVLRELAPRWNLTLGILHVNHNLRGDASRSDADFAASLAAAFNLPFFLHELDLSLTPGNLEQSARNARLAFFHRHLAAKLADRIALGHTRSDQAETVLFRFLRGSGATGLAAIRPVTAPGLVRPLIEIERPAIEAFLRRRNLPWREDASNAALEFDRNRIRHQLLPQLAREWNPAIVETLAHTADLSLAEEAYWHTQTAALATLHLTHRDGAVLIPAATLAALPLAAARRLVRHAIHLAKGDLRAIDFRHIARVLDLAARPLGSGRTQLPGLEVRRSFDWLRIAPPSVPHPYCFTPTVPDVVRVPGTDFAISLELMENPGTAGPADSVYNGRRGSLDWQRLYGPLELRNWRPGDQYQPAGVSGTEKIKTLFQQARIPVWERAQWPVLTAAGSIVWVRRFGPAHAMAAGPDSAVVLAISEVAVR
jgi:tRNA(Ile)-lysidine synthase